MGQYVKVKERQYDRPTRFSVPEWPNNTRNNALITGYRNLTINPQQILVATKNPGKIREIREILASLGVEVSALGDFADVPEPEETGDTFAENACDKARYYSRQTHLRCLADDSGLVVDALDGAPGVLSARYSGVASTDRKLVDKANVDKLLHELALKNGSRTARFVCNLALAEGDNILLEASGSVEGIIAPSPVGSNGFGYDPVFFLPEKGCSAAQLSASDKNAISHRGQALRRFAAKLELLLQ